MRTQLSTWLHTCAPEAFDDEIERQRLRVFKATMTTVQHIVNNALNNLQFVRLEAEGRLSEEMLALFDQVINDAAEQVKILGDLESVKEKNNGFGIGIEYPVAGDEFSEGDC